MTAGRIYRNRRRREQLLYDVAHELRGPMGILDNPLEIVATDYGSLSTSEFESPHGLCTPNGYRAAPTGGRFTGRRQHPGLARPGRARPTELWTIISAAVEAVEPLVQNRGQILDTSQTDEGLMLMADRRYVRNALVNLPTNAAKCILTTVASRSSLTG